MGTTVMQINLDALDNIKDIHEVIDFMGLDAQNMIVKHIVEAVDDLQKRNGLREFLRENNADILFLNLFIGGEEE